MEAYALDVVGWGFTESGVELGSTEVLGPAERRAHLLAFWQLKVTRLCQSVLVQHPVCQLFSIQEVTRAALTNCSPQLQATVHAMPACTILCLKQLRDQSPAGQAWMLV